jgi:hypothetical protein
LVSWFSVLNVSSVLHHLLFGSTQYLTYPQYKKCTSTSIIHYYLLISRVLCRWFRSRRKNTEIPSLLQQKLLRARLVDETVGEESFMPTEKIGIPIIVRQVLGRQMNKLDKYNSNLIINKVLCRISIPIN